MLIADEPTTALDVTIQAQILQRIRELRDETGAAIILVTHDLGVVADIADRIAVMYAGRIVEHGTLDEIFYDRSSTRGACSGRSRGSTARARAAAGDPGLPPSLPTGPRAATSARAARTSSPSASRCRRSRRVDEASRTTRPLLAHPERELREVRPGEIGLAAKSTGVDAA